MADPEDTWPQPQYNPGRQKHLHALGIIAINYRAFQRNMDDLYKFHLQIQKLPDALINFYYFSLSEEKRISVTNEITEEYEKDAEVRRRVNNLAEYFYWCKNCRDELLHAEQYPAMFGGAPDTLYLSKRVGKTEPKQDYGASGSCLNTEAPTPPARTLVQIVRENFAIVSASVAFVAVFASTIFLYAYLSIFDWHLIWVIER